MQLILASGSPRRSLLLASAGYDFTTDPPDVDETQLPDEPPVEYVIRVSEAKARAVIRPPGAAVLAADTTVVLDGAAIGKPTDDADALRILGSLSGRAHSVLTGWHVVSDLGERFGVEESIVRFNQRSEEELREYVERTSPLDKAGAYGIQGDNGWLIASVTGSRANVMGLPIRVVTDELTALGVVRSAP